MKQRLVSFIVMLMCSFIIWLDTTIIPVVIPTLKKDFSLSDVEAIWVINAYILALSSLLLVGGRIKEILGTQRSYLVAISLFGAASLSGALSYAQWMLILSRTIQGVGAAILIPTSQSYLREIFHEKELGKAFGTLISIGALGSILGPPLGGFLTQFVSWRAVFWINIPVVIVSIILALCTIPASQYKSHKVPLWDSICFAISIICLVRVFMNFGHESLLSSITSIGMSIVTFILFIRGSKKAEHPLVHFSLFKQRLFVHNVYLLSFGAIIFSLSSLWAIFLQQQMQYTPFVTGLYMLLPPLPIIFLSRFVGHLSDTLGYKKVSCCGLCALACSFIFLLIRQKPLYFILGFTAFGIAIPFLLVASTSNLIKKIPQEHAINGVSVGATIRQICSALGLAFFTLIYRYTPQTLGSSFNVMNAIALVCTIIMLICLLVSFKEEHEV